MNDEELKGTVRLMAIEYMVINLYARFYRLSGVSTETAAQLHSEARRRFLDTPLAGLDPVQSDLFSAELENAVGRLLNAIEETMGMRKNPLL